LFLTFLIFQSIGFLREIFWFKKSRYGFYL